MIVTQGKTGVLFLEAEGMDPGQENAKAIHTRSHRNDSEETLV